MRILTITNLYPPDVIGGYEIGCGQMVSALQSRGHHVHVLTSHPRWPVADDSDISRCLRFHDWHTRWHRPPATSEVERLMDVQAQAVDASNVGQMLNLIRDYAPDVVYLWNLIQVGALGLVGALAHIQMPVVWHLMDWVPVRMVLAGGVVAPSVARTISRRLRAKYITCSQRLADEIRTGGFEFGAHLEILPNWAHPLPAWQERQFFPGADSRLRLVAAGQLVPHKGFDVILEAARILLDAGRTDFHIDLFGTGYDDHYRGLVLKYGLGDHIRLWGAVSHPDLVERYWGYDLFLFPTWRREPFAFAPLEAGARGCVSLLSHDCGNAEWFNDGVHVVKAAPDAQAFATAIGSILDGRIDLSALAMRSRKAIASSHSIQTVVPHVERLLAAAQELPVRRPRAEAEAYHLARLAERLALDWAEQHT